MRLPCDVVNVPAYVLGDALIADTADALLSEPKPNQFLPAVERVEHLETLTIFEVTFPGWFEGVRLCFDFNVPPDWYLCRITKRCHDWLTIWPILARLRSKDPIPCSNASEVTMLDPLAPLVGMPATAPLPQRPPYL